MEHEFASAADNIKNLIGKLEKREDKSDGRIEQLEGQIKKVGYFSDIFVELLFNLTDDRLWS